ncbi:hypothetical protein KSP40_PGU004921 [Platanthera guangdongensis]|uniref:Uncharacterized protein n=1 Tax=Platanthera guangdongensis TaxID=2320717 RepID=A0ABR2M8Z9_9ASPA
MPNDGTTPVYYRRAVTTYRAAVASQAVGPVRKKMLSLALALPPRDSHSMLHELPPRDRILPPRGTTQRSQRLATQRSQRLYSMKQGYRRAIVPYILIISYFSFSPVKSISREIPNFQPQRRCPCALPARAPVTVSSEGRPNSQSSNLKRKRMGKMPNDETAPVCYRQAVTNYNAVVASRAVGPIGKKMISPALALPPYDSHSTLHELPSCGSILPSRGTTQRSQCLATQRSQLLDSTKQGYHQHVTDLSDRETLCASHIRSFYEEVQGMLSGMKVKADRDESSPYATMLAAQDIAQRCKELDISALHIKLQATGGNKTKTPGPVPNQPSGHLLALE